MNATRIFTLLLAMLIIPFSIAASTGASDDNSQLKNKLASLGIQIQSISQSPIPNLYQVLTDRGLLYITKDGTKLFHGSVYDLENGMKNLTEAALAGPRIKMLKPFEKNMLVYKAKNEKYKITVFTDITCGYCRKLHSQMKQYNDLGITVRYLAFPRQGVPSTNATNMAAIWCDDEPLKAMTAAKAGQYTVPTKQCNAEIAEQYNLGQKLGVSGTPAIILQDGTFIPGYQSPTQLLKVLERS